MKATVYVSIFIIILVVFFIKIDRDGFLYRQASKIVLPITQEWVTLPEKRLVSVFENNLTLPLNDWTWFKSDLVDYSFSPAGLKIVVNQEAVWWRNKSATGLFNLVDGDFDIQVQALTRKKSDGDSYPDQDYQFGGVILRNPLSNAFMGVENYVFNVVGYRGSRLQVETKTTRNGYSDVVAKNWPSGDAYLKLERRGDRVVMLARELEGQEWLKINAVERSDLPETLEVGLIVYATSGGEGRTDLAVKFRKLKVKQ